MSVQITGLVGPQSLTDGQINQPFRQTRSGEQAMSQVHGKFAEQALRGNIFSACNPSAQATTVALATTYTGLSVTNPSGSGKNLIILKANWVPTAAPGGIVQTGLMAGFGAVTHTAALIVHSHYLSSAMTASSGGTVALADSSATIPTPVLVQPMANGNTSAALPTSMADMTELVEGIWVVAPGGFIAIYTLTAGTGIGFIAWEEVPV